MKTCQKGDVRFSPPLLTLLTLLTPVHLLKKVAWDTATKQLAENDE